MAFRLLFETEIESSRSLDALAYDQWVEFIFLHPEPKKNADRWYDFVEDDAFAFSDTRLLLKRTARLMREADLLLSRYSPAQISQGFWCLVSAFELPDLIEDRSIERQLRLNCIYAVEELYRRLFRRPGFEKIAMHYWDALTYSFYDGGGRLLTHDAVEIQDAMYEVLCRILHQRDRICFFAAMRGLSHLKHELSAKAISECLAMRNDLSIQDHVYAISCLRGEVDLAAAPKLS